MNDNLTAPLSKLYPSTKIQNCRTVYGDIEQLAEDIEANGLINGITVRLSKDNRFEVIAGFRRYKAMSLIASKTKTDPDVKITLTNVSDDKAAFINLAENIVRKNLTLWELGTTVIRLQNSHKITYKEIVKRIGGIFSEGYISKTVKLVKNASPPVKRALEKGIDPTNDKRLTVRFLWDLANLPEKEQTRLWKAFISNSEKPSGKNRNKGSQLNSFWRRAKKRAEFGDDNDNLILEAIEFCMSKRDKPPF